MIFSIELTVCVYCDLSCVFDETVEGDGLARAIIGVLIREKITKIEKLTKRYFFKSYHQSIYITLRFFRKKYTTPALANRIKITPIPTLKKKEEGKPKGFVFLILKMTLFSNSTRDKIRSGLVG